MKKLYGVDCSNAGVHACGYSVKIAVTLEVAPDQVFSVRFRYDEDKPVGVIFTDDYKALEQTMKEHHAKEYWGPGVDREE